MNIEAQRLIAKYGLGRSGHSHFSPSGSAGWLNCSGFLLANAGKPDMAGEDAAYGTVAHGVAAIWLTAIRDSGKVAAEQIPKRFLGYRKVENGYTIEVDADMLHHIRRYIEWCEEVEYEGDVFIEQHVDYSIYTPIPKQGGTADHFVCAPGRVIITDLKMGTGIRVYAENNTQALLYALGVFLEWDWVYGFEEITVRICQPRLDYFGVWTVTRKELLEFGEYVRERAALAWVENAPRSPSPKACQWCADLGCAARSSHLETLADDAFDGQDECEYDQETMAEHVIEANSGTYEPPPPPKVSKMETGLLAWRYQHRSMFEKWFREMGEELLRRALGGETVPGWKVVNGRRSFHWTDEEEAADRLSVAGVREIYVTEVISVAKARKALTASGTSKRTVDAMFFGEEGGGYDEPIVRITPGKPTLAPDRDDREDVGDATDDAFDVDE